MKTCHSFLLSVFLFIFFTNTAVHAQADGSGSIKATVLDEKMQPMPFAVVRVIGLNIGGQTDINGVINIRGISPGTYNVEALMINYKKYTKTSVIIKAGQTTYLDYIMQAVGFECDTCTVFEIFAEKAINRYYNTFSSIDAELVRNMAVAPGDLTQMAVNVCSSCNTTPSGQLVMRGSRPGFSQTFVDGEKMYGSGDVPGLAIGSVIVLSGGIPAEYGDFIGGAIIVTTKNSISGYQYKLTMYEDLAAKQEAKRKAEAEKRGVQTTKDQIIENVSDSSRQATDSTENQINPPAEQHPQPESGQLQNSIPPSQPAQPAEQPRRG